MTLNLERLKEILGKFSEQKIAVVGDFFLDHYLILDESLNEISLETNKVAYQVVGRRLSPGAAGTIASILRSLDVQVFAVGFCGDDGNGYELKKEMTARGMDLRAFSTFEDKVTPTYTKPMLLSNGVEEELNRLDIKNYSALSAAEEDVILAGIDALVDEVDGLILMDQVNVEGMGVLTDRIRARMIEIGETMPEKVMMADSRMGIAKFSHMGIKVNNFEARAAFGNEEDAMEEIATKMFAEHTFQRPVILTQGEAGILVFDERGAALVPGYAVSGPIDVVGAGDSVTASMTAALCAGADLQEAAKIGNLTASLIVQQIGTTGVASQEDVLNRFIEFEK